MFMLNMELNLKGKEEGKKSEIKVNIFIFFHVYNNKRWEL